MNGWTDGRAEVQGDRLPERPNDRTLADLRTDQPIKQLMVRIIDHSCLVQCGVRELASGCSKGRPR